jgi:anti-anti-sigma regulatory factor
MKNKTFIIKTLNSKDSNSQTVVFEGDLGIKNAEAIKSAVQALKLNSDSVSFHLKSVEKMDITTIQTLRALSLSLKGKGKEINIIKDLPQEVERLLKNTGFDNLL